MPNFVVKKLDRVLVTTAGVIEPVCSPGDTNLARLHSLTETTTHFGSVWSRAAAHALVPAISTEVSDSAQVGHVVGDVLSR